MTSLCAALSFTLLLGSASAQTVTIPERIEKLAAKADDTVNVSLDGPLLQLAGMFLDGKNSDEAIAKNVISKLRSIHVRSFEFSKDGQYSEADVDALRAQLKSGWARVIETRENREHVEIYVKQDKGQLGGLVIISAEPRELSIVNIDGAIDLKTLSSLGGKFGIPNVAAVAKAPAASAKDSAE